MTANNYSEENYANVLTTATALDRLSMIWRQFKLSPDPQEAENLKREAHTLLDYLLKDTPLVHVQLNQALHLKPFERTTPEKLLSELSKLDQSRLDALMQGISLTIELSKREVRHYEKGDPAMLSR
jgi:hypothetical protein